MRAATLILAGTLALFCLGGCALLDGLMGEATVQATDADGKPLFKAPDGTLTTERIDPASGRANPPAEFAFVSGDSAVVSGAAGLAGMLGPWGALAGALGTLGAGIYARARNRQRLNEIGLRRQAERQLDLAGSGAAFLAGLIEKIKEGEAIDTDRNGKISIDELKAWVRAQGKNFRDPEFLTEVVKDAERALR